MYRTYCIFVLVADSNCVSKHRADLPAVTGKAGPFIAEIRRSKLQPEGDQIK